MEGAIVLLPDGSLNVYAEPILVSSILKEFPGFALKKSDGNGAPLPDREWLQLDQTYELSPSAAPSAVQKERLLSPAKAVQPKLRESPKKSSKQNSDDSAARQLALSTLSFNTSTSLEDDMPDCAAAFLGFDSCSCPVCTERAAKAERASTENLPDSAQKTYRLYEGELNGRAKSLSADGVTVALGRQASAGEADMQPCWMPMNSGGCLTRPSPVLAMRQQNRMMSPLSGVKQYQQQGSTADTAPILQGKGKGSGEHEAVATFDDHMRSYQQALSPSLCLKSASLDRSRSVLKCKPGGAEYSLGSPLDSPAPSSGRSSFEQSPSRTPSGISSLEPVRVSVKVTAGVPTREHKRWLGLEKLGFSKSASSSPKFART